MKQDPWFSEIVNTRAKASKKAKEHREGQRAEVDRVSRDSAAGIASKSAPRESMGPEELRQFLRKRKRWGITNGSVDIDARLYGER